MLLICNFIKCYQTDNFVSGHTNTLTMLINYVGKQKDQEELKFRFDI